MSDGPPASLDRLWERRDQPSREPRRGLNVDRIVQAAVELADADGLGAVSMARVAERLGFTTMSLYRHVASKDELLVLMFDAALVLGPEEPSDGWRDGLERWAWDVLAVLRRHPWWLQIPIAPPPATPNSMALFERGLRVLAGAPLHEGEKAALVLMLTGHVMWQARQEAELTEEGFAAYRSTILTRVDPERFPHVRAAVDAGIFDDEGDTRDADFAYGLAILLDGVAGRISAAGPSA